MSGLSVASGAAGKTPQIEGRMEAWSKAFHQSSRLGVAIPHVDSVKVIAARVEALQDGGFVHCIGDGRRWGSRSRVTVALV